MTGWLSLMLIVAIAGREATRELNVFQIMELRSGLGLLMLYPLIRLSGGFAALKTSHRFGEAIGLLAEAIRIGDADRALVAHVDESGPVRVVDLAPGPHVLTTREVDDARNPKVAMLSAGVDRALAAGGDAGGVMKGLRAILADHTSASDSPVDAACIHGDVYGTVSASTVIVRASRITYDHAPGRPCVTPFATVAAPS